MQEVRIGGSTPVTVTIFEANAVSEFSYIGYAAGETGTVNFDFMSPISWTHDQLFVGYEGNGTLHYDSGFMTTAHSAYIGHSSGSVGTVTVTGLGVNWNVGTAPMDSLQIGVAGTGNLSILAGASLGSGNTEIGSLTGGIGEVTVAGLASNWQNFGSLYIGKGGSGKLTVSNGGSLESFSYSKLGFLAGSRGEATVTGTQSHWQNSSEMIVGELGEGLLTISDGGKVSNTLQMTYLAHGMGSSAEVTVTGANSTWELANLIIGRSGTATLLLEAGGQLINNGMGQIGHLPGGNGTVTVTGSSSLWQNANELWVGEVGSGSLTVAAGGHVTNTQGVIGYSFGGNGEVTVTGSNSLWQNSGDLTVGYNGNAKMTIAGGGTVTNNDGIVGYSIASSLAEVTVTGPTSLWANSGNLYVDNSSTVLIEGGGTVTNENALIGLSLGSNEVTVTGQDSQWLNTGDLNLGSHGNGVLRVEAGGFVSSSLGYIGGVSGNGTGEATITGSGSQWLVDSELFVGYQGTGTLTVQNGGTATNSNGYISADGQALVTGAGSLWENEGSLSVGWSSGGTLTVADGGTVKAAVVFMSEFNNWSSSTINLNGTSGSRGVLETAALSETDQYDGAKLNFNGGILRATGHQANFLENFETADIEIKSGGAFIDSGVFNIGISTDLNGNGGNFTKLGVGTLTLSGSSSAIERTIVEDGTLIIPAGASVSGGFGHIGNSAGSVGQVTVSGADALWTLYGDGNQSALLAGVAGEGHLVITAGGRVVTDGLVVGGVEATGSGSVVVSGPGSRLESDGPVAVGWLGTSGVLTVENGGVMTVPEYTNFKIGGVANTVGYLTVTGTGSRLEGWVLDIGNYDTDSTASIDDGGVVSMTSVQFGYNTYESSATLNLLGTEGSRGVLETGSIRKIGNIAKINFDGGILRAMADEEDFLSGFYHYADTIEPQDDLVIHSGGLFIDSNGHNVSITAGSGNNTNTLVGTGGLTKQGAGSLTLEGDHLHTGGTTVEAGSLIVNGSLASGVTVAAGATLGGSGTINGSSTILGHHSPGNSPGISNHEDLSYGTGATVGWELIDNTTSGRGTDFDGINVTNDLTFTGTTLMQLAFNEPNGVSWLNPFWGVNQQWLVYSVGGTTTGFGNLSVALYDWEDGFGNLFNTARSGASFDVFQSGEDVWLRFNAAIPEPSRALLLLTGLLSMTLRRRRTLIETFT